MIAQPSARDEAMMSRVIAEANRAIDDGKVGVVALLACGDEILQIGNNTYEETRDLTAHGEIATLRAAAKRLDAMSEEERAELTIYVSLEPCLMCFAAIAVVGIKRVVYSALVEDADEESLIARGLTCGEINPRLVKGPVELVEGVMREEGRKILGRMGHLAEQSKD